jgi:hypothetical protein
MADIHLWYMICYLSWLEDAYIWTIFPVADNIDEASVGSVDCGEYFEGADGFCGNKPLAMPLMMIGNLG